MPGRRLARASPRQPYDVRSRPRAASLAPFLATCDFLLPREEQGNPVEDRGVPVEERGGSVDDTPTSGNSREKSAEASCATMVAGHRALLPAHRLRGAGVDKQEDPYRELARGAGRWRQAGSDGLSGDQAPPRDQPEGLLMLIPSRALHLFHAPLTEPAKSTMGAGGWGTSDASRNPVDIQVT